MSLPKGKRFPNHEDIIDLDSGLKGCLFIPPLSPVDDSLQLLDNYSLVDEGPANARPNVVPFDIHSFYQGAAVCWGVGLQPIVIVGSDHYATWEEFQASSIETYLRVVSSNWFSVSGRADVLRDDDGDEDEEIWTSWKGSESELDEVIQKTIDDD